MISGLEVVWLPVADMARARSFYERTLGLAPAIDRGHGVFGYAFPEGPGLALVDRAAGHEGMGDDSASFGLAFADFGAAVATCRALDLLGMEPFETDGCFGGPISDLDGNPVVLHQRKAEPTRHRPVDFGVAPVEDSAPARALHGGTVGHVPGPLAPPGWTEYELADGSALALFSMMWSGPATAGVGLKTPVLRDAFAKFKAAGLARAEDVVEREGQLFGMVRDPDGNAIILV